MIITISAFTVSNTSKLLVFENHLQIVQSAGSTCTIYGMSGQIVLLNDITSSFSEISLTGFSPGLYFAVLTNEYGNYLVKKIQVGL